MRSRMLQNLDQTEREQVAGKELFPKWTTEFSVTIWSDPFLYEDVLGQFLQEYLSFCNY